MLATLLLVVVLLLSSVVAEEVETRNLRKRTNYDALRTDLHNWIDDLTNSELLDAEDCMLYGDTSTRSSTRTGDVSFYCLYGGQECWRDDDCSTWDVCDFSGPIYRDNRTSRNVYGTCSDGGGRCLDTSDCKRGYYCDFTNNIVRTVNSGIRTCRNGDVCYDDSDCTQGGSCQDRND
eukprot:scaffold13326_cov204-Alexandrium_tamarense.AAC.21